MKRVPLTTSIILLLCFYVNAQSEVDLGSVHNGVYINPGFGFSFKYPKDWVVHGEATNKHIRELGREKAAESGALSKPSAEVALRNTYQLLTIFRHPVGTPGIGFNPAILVIAEKIDFAPGIKNGKDYLLNARPILLKTGVQVLLQELRNTVSPGRSFLLTTTLSKSMGCTWSKLTSPRWKRVMPLYLSSWVRIRKA